MPVDFYRLGAGTLHGWDDPVEPPTPTPTTVYGYNYNSDTPNNSIAGRQAKFNGRNPCPRIYTGASGHPSTFSASVMSENRCCWSFKPDNSAGATQTASWLASSAAVATYKSWLQSIPAGKEIFWCFWHEPNGGGALELDPTTFTGVYTRMKEAKAAATLQPGTKVHITANFMAYQVDSNGWSDLWVPGDAEILTWDIYGNPGVNTSGSGSNKYGTATGTAYGTTYPLVDERTAPMFRVTERTGFAKSWGVLEVNSPMRNWDTGEVGRKAWTQDILAKFDAPPMEGKVPPKICLLWEAPSGVNWVQGYGFNDAASLDSRWAGGTIPYSLTKSNNSPLWDVWYDRINSTPVAV